MSECVTVVVRCRPLNSKEKKDKRENIIQINSDDCLVSITNPISKKKNNGSVTNAIRNFTFDAVFNDQSKQRQVYDEVAYPLVESVLEGHAHSDEEVASARHRHEHVLKSDLLSRGLL